MAKTQKRTKIVCTLGPASNTPELIGDLIRSGMNVARLNFSHGTYSEHAVLIKNIRAQSKALNVPVAILQDLQGPKIRVGDLPKQGIILTAGKEVTLTTGAKSGKGKIPVTYKNLHKDVKRGEKLLLDDGLMDMTVVKVKGRDVICKVGTGGVLLSHKGINLPQTKVSASALSDKDKKDAAFGVKMDVDWVALSFVRSAKEITELRNLIKKEEKKQKKKSGVPIHIVAKIEKNEAVKNINEILAAADGIMIARGDLGVEIPAEDVPLVQKELIEKARKACKPVIVATQMLDSMMRNPRPTRAEVSDVANAVIDHTDAVMLSGETASGKYPVQSVQTMARIVQKTESSKFDDVDAENMRKFPTEEEAVSNVAAILAKTTDAKAVVVASLSGAAGRIVSRYRPELPIFVSTDHERVCRQLCISWGVIPFMLPPCRNVEELIEKSIHHLSNVKSIKKGDKLIVVAGQPVGKSGNINFVELKKV
ncbi:MAG: pyruvate kinase [Patescibacteria group bacterium]|jgi:pyruvate kinase